MIIMQNYKIFLTCIVGCMTFFQKRYNAMAQSTKAIPHICRVN